MSRGVGLLLLALLCASLAFKHTTRLLYPRVHSDCLPLSTFALRAKSGSGGTKEVFFCDQCGMEHIKWVGRCTSCKEWNTVKPFRQAKLANIGADPATSVRSKVALKNRMSTNVDGAAGGAGGADGASGAAWFGSGAALLGGGAALVPMESVELNKVTHRTHPCPARTPPYPPPLLFALQGRVPSAPLLRRDEPGPRGWLGAWKRDAPGRGPWHRQEHLTAAGAPYLAPI